MNLYFNLLKTPVFSLEDVNKYYGNMESTRSAIRRLLNQGLIMRIRKNLYTCISGETNGPIANKYQIGCALTPSAYISHHSAMEYYGVSNQVYYDVYISSQSAFKPFEFDGYTYCYVASKCSIGIEAIQYSGGVRITTKERTLIDSIKDIDKISGMEEVLANIEGLSFLQEEKLIYYLHEYHNQFLYQKIGYMLLPYQDKLELSDGFFELCKKILV